MTQPVRSARATILFWIFLVVAFAINQVQAHRRAAEDLRRHNELVGLVEQAIGRQR